MMAPAATNNSEPSSDIVTWLKYNGASFQVPMRMLCVPQALSIFGQCSHGSALTVTISLINPHCGALAIGDTGAEGKVVGLVFSALALATFARMAAVAGGLQKLPEYAPLLHWAPVACWAVAGAGLLAIAALRAQQGMMARRV